MLDPEQNGPNSKPRSFIELDVSEHPEILRIGDPGIEKKVKLYFQKKEIIVARFGEVWAAIVQASSKTAVEKLNKAKGRKPNQPLSVLCPIELLQCIADRSQVNPMILPLLENSILLKKAVCDKLFLAVPISNKTIEVLNIPRSVVSEVKNSGGETVGYVMHIISGQESDYASVQEALSPTIDFSLLSESEIAEYIQESLIAITSWNETGRGSNFDDFDQAFSLSRKHNVPIVLLPHPSRGKPHGSYGILDIGNNVSEGKRRRKSVKRGVGQLEEADQEKHWKAILVNFAHCRRLAAKEAQCKTISSEGITPSGF